MSRALLVLVNDQIRARALHWVKIAPVGTRLELKKPKRSLEQNALMWVLLTQVADQLEWHGQKYSADDWKDFVLHSLRRARWMPGEDGGMIPIGLRTSDLSKEEMTELIELLLAFGAQHGVDFDAQTNTNSAPAEGYGAGHQRANEETSMTDQPDEPEVDEIEGADDAADADNEAAEDEDGAGEGEAA